MTKEKSNSELFELRSISNSYCVIVRVRVVLKRTVVNSFCQSGPLRVIGQFSHDGTIG